MSERPDNSAPVLIAYDGSDYAKAAITTAGRELRPGRQAIVLSVYEPIKAIPFLGVAGVPVNQSAVDSVMTDIESGANGVAVEGADLAKRAGFDARPLVEGNGPAWERIVQAAEEQDASLIVLGSHGRSGISFVVLGSVATAVAQHSKRSVMIVHRDH